MIYTLHILIVYCFRFFLCQKKAVQAEKKIEEVVTEGEEEEEEIGKEENGKESGKEENGKENGEVVIGMKGDIGQKEIGTVVVGEEEI